MSQWSIISVTGTLIAIALVGWAHYAITHTRATPCSSSDLKCGSLTEMPD